MGSTFNILFYFTLWNRVLPRPTLWMGRLIKQMMHWRPVWELKDENGYQDGGCWLWPRGYQILYFVLYFWKIFLSSWGKTRNIINHNKGVDCFFFSPGGWIKHILTNSCFVAVSVRKWKLREVRTSWRITPPRCGFWWPSPGAPKKSVGFRDGWLVKHRRICETTY